MNLDYLAFLSFMVATGLYWFMGPGGPLHTIDVQSPFRTQIDDASRANSVLLWLVGAPTAAFAVVFMIFEGLFGGAAMLLFGTAALFYSFGREDYPTLTQRVLARARAGDSAGAARVIDATESDGLYTAAPSGGSGTVVLIDPERAAAMGGRDKLSWRSGVGPSAIWGESVPSSVFYCNVF